MKNLKILQTGEPAPDEPLWTDTPPRLRGVWTDILTPLMAQPGRWAELKAYATADACYSTTGNLRRGLLVRPPGRWQFVARTTLDGRFVVFGRYLGPEE